VGVLDGLLEGADKGAFDGPKEAELCSKTAANGSKMEKLLVEGRCHQF
jgi:hypothetical protein